ncbi:MAG: hypothetical protein JWN52_633 [Actinomycetia bacterium]|nr:hypothetical protein [Actinomycetes bacterium]
MFVQPDGGHGNPVRSDPSPPGAGGLDLDQGPFKVVPVRHHRVLVAVDDFGDGYPARGVRVALPEPRPYRP